MKIRIGILFAILAGSLVWGQVAVAPSAGSGTSESPYEIASLGNLYWIAASTSNWDKHYIQTADIDASSTESWFSGAGWTPIGNNTVAFTGSYDGDGCSITELFINRPSDTYYGGMGLFGTAAGATIKNIELFDCTVTGHWYVGILLGKANGTYIEYCGSTGNVYGLASVGGLVGNHSSHSLMKYCYSEANVARSLIGAEYGSRMGGLAGTNNESSKISNSYAMGSVTGYQFIGGLTGENGTYSNYQDDTARVVNSYSTGYITGTLWTGGFVGLNYNSESHNTDCVVLNSFWDRESSGMSVSHAGTSKTTAEMKTESTFTSVGWNFSNIWAINAAYNDGYPELYWKTIETGRNAVAPVTGDGSQEAPWEINSLENLYWITASDAEVPSPSQATRWSSHYIQTENIIASAVESWFNGLGWSPIGNPTIKFTGSYDGQGYFINGLYINRADTDYIGLFGNAQEAEIKNLGLKNINITGKNNVGGLVGYTYWYTAISNCYVMGQIVGASNVGGLAGQIYHNSTINASFHNGSVIGTDNIGGLLGYNNYECSINNSYNIGTVNGNTIVGGLLGYNYYSIVSKCYSTGSVGGTTDVGGLVGKSSSGGTGNSFWNKEESGLLTSAGGVGKTTSEMKTLSTYTAASWDFVNETANGADDIWAITNNVNDGYPCLMFQLTPATVTTQEVTILSATTATGNGTIIDLGFPYPISYGICWNTTGTPTIDDLIIDKGAASSTGAFTASMTDLISGLSYYVRAYAHSDAGTSYGDVVTFMITDNLPPTVTTQSVTDIHRTSATANGTVTYLGYPAETTCGVCWNTTGTPTITDDTVEYGTASLGSYAVSLDELNPGTTYYLRAYATNTSGTGYGDETVFTTIANPPTISYSSPQIYNVGIAISDLIPENAGGAIPPSYPGNVTTLAGSGTYGSSDGTGTEASFNYPSGVAVDTSGNIYVADQINHKIRKITPEGVVTTFAGSGTAGSTDATGTSASFKYPNGLVLDKFGNIYIADRENHKIRKITPEGVVTTFAGSGTAGSTDATGTSASFKYPRGVAIDKSGNIFVADTDNHRIRKITPDAVVTTFAGSSYGYLDATGTAAKFWSPTGVAANSENNIYVADNSNYRIRRITPGAVVSTFAGSTEGYIDATGTAAKFTRTYDVAVDSFGYVYVADFDNCVIRKISLEGVVVTLAGSGNEGSSNGISTEASFNYPTGVAVDIYNNVYVADKNNCLIRKISQDGYSIYPALPRGLIFDPTTGIISGTPIEGSVEKSYTITGINSGGVSTATITITVVGPTVTTQPVSNIGKTTATGNGTITNLGPTNPTSHGVCWNTTGSPTISDPRVDNGTATTTGSFTASITGIMPNTKYYVRAYAASNGVAAYGDEVLFTTNLEYGSGTDIDPYHITNINDLRWISENSSQWNKHYTQVADIDAASTSSWNDGYGFSPIGNQSIVFTGSYDGQEYTISNLTINRPGADRIGLFGHINSATLKNIGLINCSIAGHYYVGSIAGMAYSSSFEKNFSTGLVNGNMYIGGLVGYFYSSTMNNCFSSNNVNGNTYGGGLIGGIYTSSSVSNCYSKGIVTGGTVGGLAAYISSSSISNSFWDTDSSGQASSAGDAVGKTAAEMKTLTTFTSVGWDFDAIWGMDSDINDGYPYLIWSYTPDVPLPINLVKFEGTFHNGAILLTWHTASETENAAFRIYRDGEMIVELEGAGTTTEPNSYRFTDRFVIPGRTYSYILADVDLQGKETKHPEIKVEIKVEDLGLEYTIGNAYPNPFNPVTIVPLNLAKDAPVRALLYDIRGYVVKELMNADLPAGSHALKIDGSDLSTGIYILRVAVNDAAYVQKIALMK